MQSITISNNLGQKLAALVFMEVENPNYIIIICHGFRGTKLNAGKIYAFAQSLNEAGFGVVAADFAGSGDSEGSFADMTLTSQAQDLQSIINYCRSMYQLPVILLGRSFGGTSALVGGAGNGYVAGYIFWATPVMVHDTFSAIMNDEYKILKNGNKVSISDEAGDYILKPDFIADFDRHDIAGNLIAIGDKPVLIIHGLADEIVDSKNARYIYDHTINSDLLLIEKADHRFIGRVKERETMTIAWLKEHF